MELHEALQMLAQGASALVPRGWSKSLAQTPGCDPELELTS